MDVTPQELRSSEIKDSWRGYDRDEVDDLLERAAVTIESLTQDLQEASSRPAPAPVAAAAPAEVPLPSSREDAEMLQRTLLLAQRAADDAVNEAQARSKQMLEESEAKAQALVSDAEATARRIAEGERRRLEAELLDLSARREQLRADADALEDYVAGYRDRIRAAIEGDLARLGGDVEPPSDRPEIHDVEIPVERDPRRPPRSAGVDLTPATPRSPPSPHPPAVVTTGIPVRPRTRSAGSMPVATPVPRPARTRPRLRPRARRSPRRPDPSPPTGRRPHRSPTPPRPRPRPRLRLRRPTRRGCRHPTPTGLRPRRAWDAPAPWEREGAQCGRAPCRAPPAPPRSRPTCRWRPTPSTPIRSTTTRSSRRCGRPCATTLPLGPRDEEQAAFYDNSSEQDRRRFRRRR